MQNRLRSIVVGALALAGAMLVAAEAEALPIQPLSPAASLSASVEPVYYIYRRPFFRYGYGFRRPFYGYRRFVYRPYYGYRRPLYRYYRPF